MIVSPCTLASSCRTLTRRIFCTTYPISTKSSRQIAHCSLRVKGEGMVGCGGQWLGQAWGKERSHRPHLYPPRVTISLYRANRSSCEPFNTASGKVARSSLPLRRALRKRHTSSRNSASLQRARGGRADLPGGVVLNSAATCLGMSRYPFQTTVHASSYKGHLCIMHSNLLHQIHAIPVHRDCRPLTCRVHSIIGGRMFSCTPMLSQGEATRIRVVTPMFRAKRKSIVTPMFRPSVKDSVQDLCPAHL